MPEKTDLPKIRHARLNPAWLALHREEILEPELPIIDAHHHLWSRGGGYFLDDFLADAGSGHNIVASVFVQCGHAYRTNGPDSLKPVGETEFVADVAHQAQLRNVGIEVCAGIVGTANLGLGDDVEPVLHAHMQAGGSRFKGIRHITARHEEFDASFMVRPPARQLADPTFRRGFANLAKLGLRFDAWLYHTQIPEFTDLARAFPQAAMVLNHFGGPLGVGPYQGQRERAYSEWLSAMHDLARCPNVYIKLGGLGMAINGFDFDQNAAPPSSETLARAWGPYIESTIELFDAKRCMFESNFPVDKAMVSYPVLWNAFKRVTAGASAAEKAALFHATAARFYDLELR